ncbi:hypothetical protein L484_001711 [Morus notabilis]|uniref:Pentatricopeptide repeat-containing protein n=1 Tax=Morus notabilis TaxID=981085 RepID=W9RH08_9ROSA|nr:pentatricopeptide repeat-containing protein At3g21470 [Morus notabilis]EXB90557.1 hypothetical protein L484_001711 [Morus notabilis]
MRRSLQQKITNNFHNHKQNSSGIEKTSSPNWTVLTRNHISQGSPKEALRLYTQVRSSSKGIHNVLGLVPLILKACASLRFPKCGKALHAESIKSGTLFDVLVGTSLVDMYAKCREIFDARKAFDLMPERNVVTWNAMIGGYLKNGDVESAFVLFERMSLRNSVTWNEMIDGFARSGDTVSARKLFDCVPSEMKNLITWTVMVDGYSCNGEMEKAREVFEQMPERNCFAWSSMVSGYCKQGDVEEARIIFDRIPVRNLVNWNSMISGYVQNGFCEEAMKAFDEMRAQGYEADEVTTVSVLSACARSGLFDVGREIHDMIIEKGMECNQIVLNALVDMYAKCGDLACARSVFEGMTERNAACWNAMISGFAVHGQCEEALELFGKMESSEEMPDDVTFLSVLSACARGGFVDEGMDILSKMAKYGLVANVKHYGCLVDLLGRAGRLKQAYDLIKRMPVEPNDTVWGAMLGACRIHLDMEMTERVAKEINNLNSKMGSGQNEHFVLLSNIYASSERWAKAERLRLVITNEGFQKTPGCSSFMPCVS